MIDEMIGEIILLILLLTSIFWVPWLLGELVEYLAFKAHKGWKK